MREDAGAGFWRRQTRAHGWSGTDPDPEMTEQYHRGGSVACEALKAQRLAAPPKVFNAPRMGETSEGGERMSFRMDSKARDFREPDHDALDPTQQQAATGASRGAESTGPARPSEPARMNRRSPARELHAEGPVMAIPADDAGTCGASPAEGCARVAVGTPGEYPAGREGTA